MRTSLFKKARKLNDLHRVKIDIQTPKSIFFKVESLGGKEIHEVRFNYIDYVFNHSCTCKHMTLGKPWYMCAHKVACMNYMCMLEPLSVEEI